ncbi:SEH-associated 4 [Hyphodiscus hymeniophilus]|uniref:SEH-associated 4 n=1 Tax=Hyphodiscus hymeniophilus TaxID=353542 RepID=A0A9P6VNY3_9HELO|nr:SEH-associated 4 [Hyphodiscus hymeniophilus]
MDRNEGIVRWSPNPTRDEFLTFNLNQRVLQIYEPKGHANPGRFEYQNVSRFHDFPHLATYDWSPTIPGLVAIGTSHGEVHLLRVDDDSNSYITLPLKLQRLCQSVAFNTTGLLAVGLDRVRNDSCLQIWDVNQRLEGWDPKQPGWNVPAVTLDPKKLEASLSITSVRFFEDQPQTLVVGVKNQSVKIHDLRDPSSAVVTFQTRCNNNLAIDYADPNYFASSSLDHPGLMVWDRRVTSRSSASAMYLESVDQEELPWGGVLKLDQVIQTQKNVFIKQLRYCRDQRGALGILSSAGQLQVLQTNKEYVEPQSSNDVRDSPELLEVKRSYDLEYPYFDPDHKKKVEDRIVSFDWLTLGTNELPARVVALRVNGEIEIMSTPDATAGQLSQLIPWKPPKRLEDPYLNLMKFSDPSERDKVLGPLYASAAKAQIPIFGPDKFTSVATQQLLSSTVQQDLQSVDNPVINLLTRNKPKMGQEPSSISRSEESLSEGFDNLKLETRSVETEPTTSKKILSHQEQHDKAHYTVCLDSTLTKSKGELLDHVMLQRANDGYLFNCEVNKSVIKGAEEAAAADGMVSGSLDLSYMGVYTVWMDLLGEKSKSRLIDSTIIPNATQWEQLIASINKKAGRSDFDGVRTSKPQHRQLCLAICGFIKSSSDLDHDLKALEKQGRYTIAAAWALFEGVPERAVDILRRAGIDLLFVAMALDIKLKSNAPLDVDIKQWNEALENHPQMAEDAYLRAIYGYITTGNWSAIADEAGLPLRDRVGVALRYFSDDQLTNWLTNQMNEAIRTGDIEGIVLAGITDHMVDIFAKYIGKFLDYQTPILIMSFCYPRYISDVRCEAWRTNYKDFLQRHKRYILRVKFEQQSTVKSRMRDGTPVIKPPPRQITIRCLNCDAQTANDLSNSGAPPTSAPGSSSATVDNRNPLIATGINAGLCCPKCGSHLGRCAVCMEIVGVPRSDRPELSNDPAIRRMANFPTFCLKCKHVTHMDHSVAWFSRHVECPVPECRCQCNEKPGQQQGMK